MWDRIYVDEKLRELKRERQAGRAFVAERQPEAGAIVLAAKAADRPRGLRAGFASRLARIALILHREAATDAGLQSRSESPR